MIKPLRTNNQIRAAQVHLIDDQGSQLGTVSTLDALKMARERDLDLVEVGPNVSPPIAKIMDYGKYVYQKERQEKKSGARPKEQELKTVRVGFKTGIHDLKFKAQQVGEFLEEGHMVKIELTLRGREKGLAGLGKEKLHQFLGTISIPYIAHDQVKKSPYGWNLIIQKDKVPTSKKVNQ